MNTRNAPQPFQIPLADNERHPNGSDARFMSGVYFPATDLCVNDMGGRGTGRPKGVQWLTGVRFTIYCTRLVASGGSEKCCSVVVDRYLPNDPAWADKYVTPMLMALEVREGLTIKLSDPDVRIEVEPLMEPVRA